MPPAMMGGGVCWLDYDNDGWMDLFVVNSYADANLPELAEARRPAAQRALPRTCTGRFVNVSRTLGRRTSQVRGNGCVAADFNGDGHTDLYVTTAVDDKLLWNNGNGTFSEGARVRPALVSFGWHSGAAVADVNGDGRPDLFVAGYTNMNAPIPRLGGRLPDEPRRRARRALPERGQRRPNGQARFREVGAAGRARARALRPQPRRRLHRRQRRRPPRSLRRERRGSEPPLHQRPLAGGRRPTGGLGFHFVDRGHGGRRRRHERRHGRRAPATTTATGRPTCSSPTRAASRTPSSRGAPAPAGSAAFAQHANRSSTPHSATGLRRAGATPGSISTTTATPTSSLANGAIPVMNLRQGRRARSRCSRISRARARPGPFGNASGVVDQTRPAARSSGAASRRPTSTTTATSTSRSTRSAARSSCSRTATRPGNWLEVSLRGFHPGAIVTATLPDGRKLVARGARRQQLPLVRGSAPALRTRHRDEGRALVVRYPDGHRTRLANVAANQILTVKP